MQLFSNQLGYSVINLLQIFHRMWRWKTYENRSIFGKDNKKFIGKSLWLTFWANLYIVQNFLKTRFWASLQIVSDRLHTFRQQKVWNLWQTC